MYVGVPITAPVFVAACAEPMSVSFAMPKSSSLIRSPFGMSGSGTRKMLSGLRSRWTMPLSCAAASALHTPRRSAAASPSGIGPRVLIRRASVTPSRNSITM